MDIGIKVSKPGTDVSSTDVSKMSLHSEHPCFIIRKEGYTSKSVTSGTTQSFYAGGTFYLDNMFLAFVEVDGSGKWFAPYITENASGGGIKIDPYIEIGKSQSLTVDVTATSGTHNTKTYTYLLWSKIA